MDNGPYPLLLACRPGQVDYADALDWQERLMETRQEEQIPDTLLLLEHPPTITFGSRHRPDHLRAAPEELERRGICLQATRRGGDVTFHGPGQIVGYPILDLNRRGRDLHRYVRQLEEVLIRTVGSFGIRGERIPGLTGVWAGDEKIAAIGVEVRKWVTRHGFALNVTTDLAYFDLIVPCGIADKSVTSMERLLGKAPPREDVESALLQHFQEVFGYAALEERDRAALSRSTPDDSERRHSTLR